MDMAVCASGIVVGAFRVSTSFTLSSKEPRAAHGQPSWEHKPGAEKSATQLRGETTKAVQNVLSYPSKIPSNGRKARVMFPFSVCRNQTAVKVNLE